METTMNAQHFAHRSESLGDRWKRHYPNLLRVSPSCRCAGRPLARYVLAIIVYLVFFVVPIAQAQELVNSPLYETKVAPIGASEGLLGVRPVLFTGAATFRIPLAIPPGIAGVEPHLSLEYDSQRGLGNAGWGWVVELPKIARSTRYGHDRLQAQTPKEAVFVYEGVELVRGNAETLRPSWLSSECPTLTRYWKEVDTFEKILYCEEKDFFVVITKDGTRSTFGRQSASNSKLRHPYTSQVMGYYLDEVVNTHGLYWRAIYSTYSGPNSLGEAPRLLEIQYTLYNGGTPGELRRVVLNWQSRPDTKVERLSFGF